MNKEEYIKLVKSHRESYNLLKIQSYLETIANILVNNNLTTKEELNKIIQEFENIILEENFKKEDKESLKAAKTFNDLFGGILKGE